MLDPSTLPDFPPDNPPKDEPNRNGMLLKTFVATAAGSALVFGASTSHFRTAEHRRQTDDTCNAEKLFKEGPENGGCQPKIKKKISNSTEMTEEKIQKRCCQQISAEDVTFRCHTTTKSSFQKKTGGYSFICKSDGFDEQIAQWTNVKVAEWVKITEDEETEDEKTKQERLEKKKNMIIKNIKGAKKKELKKELEKLKKEAQVNSPQVKKIDEDIAYLEKRLPLSELKTEVIKKKKDIAETEETLQKKKAELEDGLKKLGAHSEDPLEDDLNKQIADLDDQIANVKKARNLKTTITNQKKDIDAMEKKKAELEDGLKELVEHTKNIPLEEDLDTQIANLEKVREQKITTKQVAQHKEDIDTLTKTLENKKAEVEIGLKELEKHTEDIPLEEDLAKQIKILNLEREEKNAPTKKFELLKKQIDDLEKQEIQETTLIENQNNQTENKDTN